eukprot:GHVT01016832.1.p2 GENE.GHVT01016832.1~~GHVT01016832.1.p2  ORF type:complete len:141 (-),score=39.47 GHVT01016832.1:2216-2638(-)
MAPPSRPSPASSPRSASSFCPSSHLSPLYPLHSPPSSHPPPLPSSPSSSSATEALDVFSPPDLASVPELLGLHFHRIKNLRKKLGKVLSHVHDSHLSDNLFLLRYVLSYKGNEEQAASAIIRATEFRRHHANFVKVANQL